MDDTRGIATDSAMSNMAESVAKLMIAYCNIHGGYHADAIANMIGISTAIVYKHMHYYVNDDYEHYATMLFDKARDEFNNQVSNW